MRRKSPAVPVDPLSTLEAELHDLSVLAGLIYSCDPHTEPAISAYLGDRVREHVERARAAVPWIYKLLPRPEASPPIAPAEAARITAGVEAIFRRPAGDDHE